MENGNHIPMKVVKGEYGYILEDVPHLSDYIPHLPTYPNPLQDHPAYSVVKQYFVHADDTVIQKVVVHKDSPRGIHFRRAGPRQKVLAFLMPCRTFLKACLISLWLSVLIVI
ncbi:ATP-dependent 6-phosphofructokinase 3 [Bienertia sinuspersici]